MELGFDSEMCDRAKEIIPGLLRSMNKMEIEIPSLKEHSSMLQRKARRLKMYILLQWVVIGMWFQLIKSKGKN